jgi:hypothetical protein
VRAEGYAGISLKHRGDLEKFEKGMGIVLRNAWKHIEALQSTDILLLISYIGEVISQDSQDEERIANLFRIEDLEDRQELLVIQYLYDILTNVDDVGEDRIMPLIREQNILKNLALFLQKHHKKLNEKTLARTAETMNLICETEDFQTYEDAYIGCTEDEGVFQSLSDLFLRTMEEDYEQRRKIRSLLELVCRCDNRK